MSVKSFVTGSAAILAVWLGVTFVREVPGETYPQLGRDTEPLTAEVQALKPMVAKAADEEVAEVAVVE